MADTSVQREVERWLREHWLPEKYGQPFVPRELRLSSGGTFEFDAVSQNGKIAVTISTSGAQTATGRYGSGKVQKIRADALFLVLAQTEQQILLFTERDMFELCRGEHKRGRLPRELRIVLADLPAKLRSRLKQARLLASSEVSPARAV